MKARHQPDNSVLGDNFPAADRLPAVDQSASQALRLINRRPFSRIRLIAVRLPGHHARAWLWATARFGQSFVAGLGRVRRRLIQPYFKLPRRGHFFASRSAKKCSSHLNYFDATSPNARFASPVLLAVIGLGSLETLLALVRVHDTEAIGTADVEEVEVELPIPDDAGQTFRGDFTGPRPATRR
jgi:hypothetical protein